MFAPWQNAGAPNREAIIVVPGASSAPLRGETPGGGLGGMGGAAATPGRLLGESLALAPRSGDGAKAGFIVTPESDAATLARHRLRAGDILLDIDGAPLDPARIRGLGDELAAADAIEITYERDGQIRNRLLTFEQ